MALRILIVDDNHSFIDSLKVMLRDLSLDFSHAYRYSDALRLLQEHGSFYTLPEHTDSIPKSASDKPAGDTPLVRNEQGFFLIIVEQNAETSMKGTEFIAHTLRKYPGLNETNFILLTHRMSAVPPGNYGYPVLEKPVRAAQIRQLVLQKIKQAQERTSEESASAQPIPPSKADKKSARQALRKLLTTPEQKIPTATTEKEEKHKTLSQKPAKRKRTSPKRSK